MIISSSADYRAAAQQFLPPFLFHYIVGGAYAEQTLRRNVDDFAAVALRQRLHARGAQALGLQFCAGTWIAAWPPLQGAGQLYQDQQPQQDSGDDLHGQDPLHGG